MMNMNIFFGQFIIQQVKTPSLKIKPKAQSVVN